MANELVQVIKELLERSRRTQKPTSQRSVNIIKTQNDTVNLEEMIVLDDTQAPENPQWALPPTWDVLIHTQWSAGGEWRTAPTFVLPSPAAALFTVPSPSVDSILSVGVPALVGTFTVPNPEAEYGPMQLLPTPAVGAFSVLNPTFTATGGSVIFDAATEFVAVSNNSSHSFTGHIPSGGNRLAVIGIAIDSGSTTVDEVKYGGSTMTLLDTHSAGRRLYLYYLPGPAASAALIEITLSDSRRCSAALLSFTGVHQTVPFGTLLKANGTATTTPNVQNVASASGELVLDIWNASGVALSSATPDGGQTEVAGNFASEMNYGMSVEAGATDTDMGWTLDTAKTWAAMAVPIKPV